MISTAPPNQDNRWFNPDKRPVALIDAEILKNPYRVSGVDLDDPTDGPVSMRVWTGD